MGDAKATVRMAARIAARRAARIAVCRAARRVARRAASMQIIIWDAMLAVTQTKYANPVLVVETFMRDPSNSALWKKKLTSTQIH